MKNFVTSDLRTDEKMNHAGGQGPMYIKHLLGKEELNDKCGLYAEVTIPAGSALGYHEHVGNSETYYVLKGACTLQRQRFDPGNRSGRSHLHA